MERITHFDYVARWSLWLHHPWLAGGITAGVVIIAVVCSVWGVRRG
jgi:hypothetical protein